MTQRIAFIFATMLFAMPAFAVDDKSCDFKCGPIDCEVIKNNPDLRCDKLASVLSDNPTQLGFEHIGETRLEFWESYEGGFGDKKWNAEMREEFAQKLFAKDFYYLKLHLAARILSFDKSDLADLVDEKLDGGIPESARKEFNGWVYETLEALGGVHNNLDVVTRSTEVAAGLLSAKFRRAINLTGPDYQAYVMERDWAEFMAYGKLPREWRDPKLFGVLMYCRFGKVPYQEATTIFAGMNNALGANVVGEAAKRVALAPKNANGEIKGTLPVPVKRGPGGTEVEDYDTPRPDDLVKVYSNPLVLMEVLATHDDDRRYLLFLLKGLFRENRQLLDPGMNKWTFAANAYDALVRAFGKDDVLQAAHAVRTAKKRLLGSTIFDQKSIGATRNEPWTALEDILARKNPKGYVKATLMFFENYQSPASVDPDAAYKKFVSENGEDKVRNAGRIAAAGKPNLVYRGEIALLRHYVTAPPVEKEEKPAAPLVDFPQYVAWKKFAAGAKVSYTSRIWQPDRFNPDRLVPGPPYDRYGYLLQSINSEQAKLWSTTQVFNSNGTPHPPRDIEIAYPAKFTPPPRYQPPREVAPVTGSNIGLGAKQTPSSTESGEEILEINGKRFATKWQSATYGFDWSYEGCTLVVKVWTSDEVPTGLVRKTEDRICATGQSKGRYIMETYLDSFDGFTPATVDSSKPVAAPYAPVPATPTPVATAPVPVARPQPSSAPAPKPVAQQPQPAAVLPKHKLAPPPARVPTPAGFPPEAAAQFELAQRSNQAMFRVQQVKRELTLQGGDVPANIRTARDGLDGQMNAALRAMVNRDNAAAAQALQSAEHSLAVIEKYLGQ